MTGRRPAASKPLGAAAAVAAVVTAVQHAHDDRRAAMALNPDCRAGKHAACAGDAWDDEADAQTACGCECHR